MGWGQLSKIALVTLVFSGSMTALAPQANSDKDAETYRRVLTEAATEIKKEMTAFNAQRANLSSELQTYLNRPQQLRAIDLELSQNKSRTPAGRQELEQEAAFQKLAVETEAASFFEKFPILAPSFLNDDFGSDLNRDGMVDDEEVIKAIDKTLDPEGNLFLVGIPYKCIRPDLMQDPDCIVQLDRDCPSAFSAHAGRLGQLKLDADLNLSAQEFPSADAAIEEQTKWWGHVGNFTKVARLSAAVRTAACGLASKFQEEDSEQINYDFPTSQWPAWVLAIPPVEFNKAEAKEHCSLLNLRRAANASKIFHDERASPATRRVAMTIDMAAQYCDF